MKKDIHPPYYPQTSVECACGNKFIVGSTVSKIQTDICSKCHPFYTGQAKIIDATGQIKKFEERTKKSVILKTTKTSGSSKKTPKNTEKKETTKKKETK